jgi:hydrogenase maturation protease
MSGTAAERPGRVVIFGLGNEFRRDDGAGLAVAGRLRARALRGVTVLAGPGEPSALLAGWTGAALAIVVDAVVASPPVPGRLHRLVAGQDGTAPPGWPAAASSHGLGLAEAIGLGAALDRLPGRLILHGVEAAELALGAGLSPAVAAALPALEQAVLRDLPAECGGWPGGTRRPS